MERDSKNVNDIQTLLKHAKSKRTPHESEIKEAYELTFPAREFDRRTETPPDRDRIFDATAIRGVRNLNTNIMKLLIPQNQPWAEIVYQQEGLRKQLGSRLANPLRVANQTLFNHFTDSNFYIATTEALNDNIIAGTMCVMILDDGENPISYMPVPIDELYFLEDHDGTIAATFREHELTAQQLASRFGDKLPADVAECATEKPAETYKLTESVIPDGDAWRYCVHLQKGWECIEDEQTPFNPFIIARWEKILGQTWGNSPVRNALPHIKTVQDIVRDTLAFGAWAALGGWQIPDETVNTENLNGTLKPGCVIAVDEPLQPLQFPGSFNLTFDMAELERAQIETLLHDSTPPSDEALKYMTAEAIIHLRQEFLSQIGEPAQRLQREFLQPIAQQVVARLMIRGDIPELSVDVIRSLKVEGVNNAMDIFKVNVNAAIQRALKIQEASDIMNAIGRVIQIAGPQMVATHVKLDDAVRTLLESFGLPPHLLREEKEVAKIKDQQEQQQAQLAFMSLLTNAGAGQGQGGNPMQGMMEAFSQQAA